VMLAGHLVDRAAIVEWFRENPPGW
jgi:hypothetical protein